MCDESHSEFGWKCAQSTGPIARIGLLSSNSLYNLASRLSHEFDIPLVDELQNSRIKRLMVLSEGSDYRKILPVIEDLDYQSLEFVFFNDYAEVPNNFQGATQSCFDLDSLSLWDDLKQLVLSSGKSRKSSHKRAKKVFLSHAVQDEVIILKTVEYLRSYLGMEVFVCADSIEYGKNWHSEIEGKLRESELLLFLVSQSSVQSTFCAYEIGYAQALDIPVRLVSLDGSKPPSYLQSVHMADCTRVLTQKPWLDFQAVLLEEILQSCIVK